MKPILIGAFDSEWRYELAPDDVGVPNSVSTLSTKVNAANTAKTRYDGRIMSPPLLPVTNGCFALIDDLLYT
jgi:hypothetical protein